MRGPTLNDKLTEARAIIDAHKIGERFSDEDLKRLGDLTDSELAEAFRAKNPAFPGDKRHLHVRMADWVEPDQWSWVNAIKIAHARDPEEARRTRAHQKMMRALRTAIQDEMNEFRSSVTPRQCAWCESLDNLSTDHVAPPFSRIANDFIKERGVIELVESQGRGDIIKDADVEAEWIAYHAHHAVYQLLCRACNSSKGAR